MLFLWYHTPYHKTVTRRINLPDALQCFLRICKISTLLWDQNAQIALKMQGQL